MDAGKYGYTCAKIGPSPNKQRDYYYGMVVKQLLDSDKDILLSYWNQNYRQEEGELNDSDIVPWKAAEKALMQSGNSISFESKRLNKDQYYYGMRLNQLESKDAEKDLNTIKFFEDENELEKNDVLKRNDFKYLFEEDDKYKHGNLPVKKLRFSELLYSRDD